MSQFPSSNDPSMPAIADGAAALRKSATALGEAMIRARLLSAMPNLDRVFDGSYL